MYNIWFSYLWYVIRHFSIIKFMELEDKKHFKNYFTAWIVIICLLFCAIIFFIFIPNASALETAHPVYNSGGVYGYKIPNRIANQESNNYFQYFYNKGGNQLVSNDNINILNRYCDEVGQGQCAYTGTGNIELTNIGGNGSNYLWFGFHPGFASTTAEEMLEDGSKIYYDGAYSYQFNIEIWSQNQLDIAENLHLASWFGTYGWNNGGNEISLEEQFFDNEHNFYVRRYTMYVGFRNGSPYYSNAGKFLNSDLVPGFCGSGSCIQEYTGPGGLTFTLNSPTNFTNFGTIPGINGVSYMAVSEPYNIVYWDSQSTLTCDSTCWTYEQTLENNGWGPEQQTNYNHEFFKKTFFRDFGLGGVFTHLIDKFKYYLNSYNENSCHNLNITIMGKQIQIPCGKTLFWGRNDISIFANIWSVFWSGFVAFFIARKIYSNLMVLFNDDFKFKDVVDL